jgi:hypothetical protein
VTASAETSSDTPSVGARRAVRVSYELLSLFEPESPDVLDVPEQSEGRHDKGPWELQEWDGERWETVGSATKRRTRNRFLRHDRS